MGLRQEPRAYGRCWIPPRGVRGRQDKPCYSSEDCSSAEEGLSWKVVPRVLSVIAASGFPLEGAAGSVVQ